MGFVRDEELRGCAARNALPPVARDFYRAEHAIGIVMTASGVAPNPIPAGTFLGLRCKVCQRIVSDGHRPSCPVPKAERALAKVAAMRKPKGTPTDG